MKHLLPFNKYALVERSTVDALLDKIAAHGMDSLTPNERQYLDNHSQGKKSREIKKGERFEYRIGNVEFAFIYDYSDGVWDFKFDHESNFDMQHEYTHKDKMPTHYGRIETDEYDYDGQIMYKEGNPHIFFVRTDESESAYDEEEGYPSVTFEEDHPEVATLFIEVMTELAVKLNNSIDPETIK